jgi:hypothetical protein
MAIACPLALVFLLLLPFGILALHDVNRPPTRQFTIRGMMLFIFLWAVCLSQISAASFARSQTLAWRQYCVVPFAWIVLAICYWRTRQFAALLIHCIGILFVLSYLAIAFADSGGGTWKDIEMDLLLGMIAGSFLGLIFFSLMMLLTILGRPLSPPPHKEDHQP